mgnify:FL=1
MLVSCSERELEQSVTQENGYYVVTTKVFRKDSLIQSYRVYTEPSKIDSIKKVYKTQAECLK